MVSEVDVLSADLAEFGALLGTAPDESTLQRRYVERVGRYVPGLGAGVYLLGGEAEGVLDVTGFGVSSYFLARYEAAGRACDPVFGRMVSTRRAAFSSDLMSAEDWMASELYEEVLHVHRMGLTAQAPILHGERIVGTLNWGRRVGGADFTAFERSLVEGLARVVSLALACIRERAGEVRTTERLRVALGLVDQAVVVTDLATAERYSNAAARALLTRLESTGSSLDEVVAQPGHVSDGVVAHEVVIDTGGDPSAVLRTRTVRPAERIEVTFLEILPGNRPLRPLDGTKPLTQREREVARLAAWGLTDVEIAQRLFISPNTVKGYLKACYRKLGVRSRVALARRTDL